MSDDYFHSFNPSETFDSIPFAHSSEAMRSIRAKGSNKCQDGHERSHVVDLSISGNANAF